MFEMVGRNISEVNHEVNWEKLDIECRDSVNGNELKEKPVHDDLTDSRILESSDEDYHEEEDVINTSDTRVTDSSLLNAEANKNTTAEEGAESQKNVQEVAESEMIGNESDHGQKLNDIEQNGGGENYTNGNNDDIEVGISINNDINAVSTKAAESQKNVQEVAESEISGDESEHSKEYEENRKKGEVNTNINDEGIEVDSHDIYINNDGNAGSTKAAAASQDSKSQQSMTDKLGDKHQQQMVTESDQQVLSGSEEQGELMMCRPTRKNLSEAEKHRQQMVTESRQQALRGSKRQGDLMICRATKKLGKEPEEGDVVRLGVSGHDVNKLMSPAIIGVVVGSNKKRSRYQIATATGELIGGTLPRNHITVLPNSSRKCMNLEDAFKLHATTAVGEERTSQQEKKRQKLAQKGISKRTAITRAFPKVSVAGGMVKVYCKCTKGTCKNCKCTKFDRKCTDACHGGKKNPNCINCM